MNTPDNEEASLNLNIELPARRFGSREIVLLVACALAVIFGTNSLLEGWPHGFTATMYGVAVFWFGCAMR